MYNLWVKFLFLLLFLPAVSYAEINSAAFFYGNKVPVSKLCAYGSVVIDPDSDFKPKEYCNTLSKPLAYVSLGEVRKGVGYEKEIKKDWVMGSNPAWHNNKVMDQTKIGWQNYFIKQLIVPLWDAGYRGFFLDTLDSYTLSVKDPSQQKKQIAGMVKIIKEIKHRYPEAEIIVNRGFQLLPYIHEDVNAVVIESLYNGWHQDKKAYKKTSKKVQDYLFGEIAKIKQWKLPIIIIDFLPPKKRKQAPILAKKIKSHGLIPWVTNNSLSAIYISNLKQVSRNILIVFSNKNNLPIQLNPDILYIGTILEYMGYVPKYINLADSKSSLTNESSNNYAGVIFHIFEQSPKNKYIFNWALGKISENMPVVFMDSFAIPITSKQLSSLGVYVSMEWQHFSEQIFN